jgi:hypothetical protein
MKIRPVGSELFRANRQADGEKDRHSETDISFSKFLLTRLKIKMKILGLPNYL